MRSAQDALPRTARLGASGFVMKGYLITFYRTHTVVEVPGSTRAVPVSARDEIIESLAGTLRLRNVMMALGAVRQPTHLFYRGP